VPEIWLNTLYECIVHAMHIIFTSLVREEFFCFSLYNGEWVSALWFVLYSHLSTQVYIGTPSVSVIVGGCRLSGCYAVKHRRTHICVRDNKTCLSVPIHKYSRTYWYECAHTETYKIRRLHHFLYPTGILCLS